jgi:hypothetical protein
MAEAKNNLLHVRSLARRLNGFLTFVQLHPRTLVLNSSGMTRPRTRESDREMARPLVSIHIPETICCSILFLIGIIALLSTTGLLDGPIAWLGEATGRTP